MHDSLQWFSKPVDISNALPLTYLSLLTVWAVYQPNWLPKLEKICLDLLTVPQNCTECDCIWNKVEMTYRKVSFPRHRRGKYTLYSTMRGIPDQLSHSVRSQVVSLCSQLGSWPATPYGVAPSTFDWTVLVIVYGLIYLLMVDVNINWWDWILLRKVTNQCAPWRSLTNNCRICISVSFQFSIANGDRWICSYYYFRFLSRYYRLLWSALNYATLAISLSVHFRYFVDIIHDWNNQMMTGPRDDCDIDGSKKRLVLWEAVTLFKKVDSKWTSDPHWGLKRFNKLENK